METETCTAKSEAAAIGVLPGDAALDTGREWILGVASAAQPFL